MSIAFGPQVVNSNLLVYLDSVNPKSYPGSGAAWSDISGNANHVALSGTPVYNSTQRALTFSRASTQYGKIAALSALNTLALTVEVGIKMISLPAIAGYTGDYSRIIVESSDNYSIISSGFNMSVEYELTGPRFMAGLKGDGGFNLKNIVSPLFTLTWACWSVVFDKSAAAGSEITHYLNGVLVTNTAQTANGGIAYSTNNTNLFTNLILNIMSRNGTICSDGYLSFFRLYNRGLSALEVAGNFNAMRGRFSL